MNTGVPVAADHWGGIITLGVIAVFVAIGLAFAILGARGVGRGSAVPGSRRVTRRQDDIRFRTLRLVMVAGVWVALRGLQLKVFNDGRQPSWWWEHLLQQASWAWTAAAPAAIVGAVSILLSWRNRPDATGLPIDQLVCFRVVSRGLNSATLLDTVGSIRSAMAARPLFRYCIEVVVDNPVDLSDEPDLTVHVVPRDYVTPNRSKYKARALHYSVEVSTLPPDAWIFHCDEESQVMPGLVGGIRDAVSEEELRSEAGLLPRIGQGTILYTRNLGSHPVLSLADSLRTGDDITRFATQFRSGMMFCGMHGSFILCRSDIENRVSFDVGPQGSITEDAWWAYEQSAHGVGFRWVDGYLFEQSPESWRDFAKQRRRWYSGLWKVALYAPASIGARVALMAFLCTWLVSSIGGLYTFVNLFTGLATPVPVQIVGSLVFSWYLNTYVTGLWIALRSMPVTERPSWLRCAALYVAQVLLMPVFGALEAAGVVLAVLRPETGFHVIKKSGTTGAGVADAGLDVQALVAEAPAVLFAAAPVAVEPVVAAPVVAEPVVTERRRGGRGDAPEVRAAALSAVLSGEPVRQVAATFGVSRQTIYNWRHQYLVDIGDRPGITSAQRDELYAARRAAGSPRGPWSAVGECGRGPEVIGEAIEGDVRVQA